MPTVREAVIKLLADLGMTTIFGNPGSTELPLFRDFPKEFRYVLGLQESIVVGMADGYAQATGNAALVNLHSAAGVGHAMGNVLENLEEEKGDSDHGSAWWPLDRVANDRVRLEKQHEWHICREHAIS